MIAFRPYTFAIRVLFVCTGNICRSPVAAAALVARLPAHGTAAAWSVESAGTRATLGRPPHEVIKAAARIDLDVGTHRSQQVTAELVELSDLVVGMSREHVQETSLMVPGAFGRSFTLRELVAALDRLAASPHGGAGGTTPGGSVGDVLARLGQDRSPSDLLLAGPDIDVADPYGGPQRGYDRMAVEIHELVGRLAQWVHGAVTGAP